MTAKNSKKDRPKVDGAAKDGQTDALGDISSAADLKSFLLSLRDRMTDGQAAPVYAFSLMNLLLSRSEFFSLFDTETKEIARDIWLRLKQSGIQARNPAFLFGLESSETVA